MDRCIYLQEENRLTDAISEHVTIYTRRVYSVYLVQYFGFFSL